MGVAQTTSITAVDHFEPQKPQQLCRSQGEILRRTLWRRSRLAQVDVEQGSEQCATRRTSPGPARPRTHIGYIPRIAQLVICNGVMEMSA